MTERLIEEIISYRHKDLLEENRELKQEIDKVKKSRVFYRYDDFGCRYVEIEEEEITKSIKRTAECNLKLQREQKEYLEWIDEVQKHWAFKLFIRK